MVSPVWRPEASRQHSSALSRDLLISVAVATLKAFRRPTTPLRLLSRVDDLADKRIGSSYVPQWGALTGPSCTEPTFNSRTDQYKKWLYWPQKNIDDLDGSH